MKWIVIAPDGREVESYGSSASDAASNFARHGLPEPKAVGQTAVLKVRRKTNPKVEEVVHMTTHCYWSEDLEKKYGPQIFDNG